MKKFAEYLTETHKVYPFKIGIAGDLPEGCEDNLKRCLEKFAVKSLSAAKKTPIQERPLDFPQLENIDVRYYEAELQYPSTPDAIQEYIGNCCGVEQSHIIVRSPTDPREEYQEKKEDKEYEPMLTTEELDAMPAQEQVGGQRIMDLLKELETARKERDDAQPGFEMEKPAQDSTNTESVVGS
jgi:hypothetical protein